MVLSPFPSKACTWLICWLIWHFLDLCQVFFHSLVIITLMKWLNREHLLKCGTITCLDPESEDIFSHSHKGEFVIIFKSGPGKRLISQVGTWAQPRFHFYVCDRIGIVLLSAFCQGWGRLRIGNVIITRPHTIRQVQMETQLQIHQH